MPTLRKRNPDIHLAKLLADLFWPEFVEFGGCVFAKCAVSRGLLKRRESHFVRAMMASGQDRTGIEALENHIHIIEQFRAAPDRKAAELFGRKMAEAWFAKLRRDFPADRFRVYFTKEDNPIVRFHRVYQGEAFWLDEDTWKNDIRRGSVVVLDTKPANMRSRVPSRIRG
jgi:hypothetical protein